MAMWCDNCGVQVSGDCAGRQRLPSLCKSCRAQRKAFSHEQGMFRRVGCGDCAACRVTEDCGVCMVCTAQLAQLPWSTCAQRLCLRRSGSCGLCSGCQTEEDSGGSGACRVCEREQNPGFQRQREDLQPRSLKKQKQKSPRGPPSAGKLPSGWRQGLVPAAPAPAVRPSRTAKRCSRGRQSRRCGVCVACQRSVDCGQCDFCQDKPRFGGCNQKRQKCRWRQCLRFAIKCLLPTAGWHSRTVEGAVLPRHRSRRRKRASSGGFQGQRLVTEALSSDLEKGLPVLTEGLDTGVMSSPGPDRVILEEEEEGDDVIPVLPDPPSIILEEYECPGLGVFMSSPPPVKQKVESYGAHAPGAASPPPADFSPGLCSKAANRAQLQHSLKQAESSGKGEEEEEAAKANTPVIMEIYSLRGATPTAAGPCGGLDSVLQEFLAELNELPLPAHWEVLPLRGPDLRIIQCSPLSTVAAAVIHIQPGLYFRVVVEDFPVPSSHELYLAHPLRLTTVDEVIELICDLEGYHLCPGSWQQGRRSPDCDVLVYEGCCQACWLELYPSESSWS